jgi:nucleotide-binding universal stress UspA family protein
MSGAIERIVVPLDAVAENRPAIEVAARLAAHVKARLVGVFIEDEELLHLARLPFARDITLAAEPVPLSLPAIEQQFRLAAERARKELAAAAARQRIAWVFEVVRPAADDPLVAVTERDLVVASASTRPIGRHFRVEWRWWSAIERITGPFLLARRDWSAEGAILAWIRDQSAEAAQLLDLAARLAEAAGGALTVICPPHLVGKEGFEGWIATQIAAYSVRLRIEMMPAEPAALDRRLRELGCRCLALHANAVAGRADGLRALFSRLACDILVMP